MAENGEGLVEAIGRAHHLEADVGSTVLLGLVGEVDQGAGQLQVDRLAWARELGIEARGIGNVGDQPVETCTSSLTMVLRRALLVGTGILQGLDGAAQRVSRFLSSWLTSAAKASMASIRR